MKRFIQSVAIWSFGLYLFLSPIGCNRVSAATDRSKLRLAVEADSFEVEIAATPDLRMLGLMHRNYLPEDTGMLFIYPKAKISCMWMHNTHFPLSVAFVDEQGIIVNIEEMEPHTDDYHCAVSPVRYAIEMPSGWFNRNGIRPGSFVNGLEKAPAGR